MVDHHEVGAAPTIGVNCTGVWWPAECFQAAEELGFSHLWTSEHFVFHRPILDSVPMLGAIAGVTKSIRIGPAAAIATLKHPTILAKELATVDVISGGRLTVVLGMGGEYAKEYESVGVPLAGRARRFTETVQVLRRYWTEEHFTHRGELFQLDDVGIAPRSSQPGGPPIWLGGRSPSAIMRAALHGDGYMPYLVTPARCRDAFARVRDAALAKGLELRPGFTNAAAIYVSMNESRARAREIAVADLSWRYNTDFSAQVDRFVISGPPEDCIEGIGKYVEAGAAHVSVTLLHEDSVPKTWSPRAEQATGILEVLRQFGEMVLPEVSRMRPSPVAD